MPYENYLINFHKDHLKKILYEGDVLKHFSIIINFLVLYENAPNLGLELLNEDPDICLSEWDSATLKAQMSLLKDVDRKCELKPNVHCRIYELPAWSYINRSIFPDKKDVGKFLQVSGTVMRSSEAKLLKYIQTFVCIKCKEPITVRAEYETKYSISQPNECSEGCSGKSFMHIDDDKCKDYQEIKIQERVKDFGVSSMPNTMLVTLEDDIVDICKPGDNVTICGVVKMRWGEFRVGCKIEIDITMKANYIQVDNISSSRALLTPEIQQLFNSFWENYADNPLLGRDTILSSFCPKLYGLYWVKLAIAIILAGGSPLEDTTFTGIRTRAESHLLLVGDPGTGKSQLLKFASKIIPRAVLTTGIGSTAAGLTVSALKEHGEWQLEAGALVLSDGGICCIDEFNSMKEHDRTSIHEAMEQQTISVAKAGIVSKFNTRCSILAACNPKGNIDPCQPLHMSIALPSSLLSRFDLVLMLRDTVNVEWDSLVAGYILNGGYNFSKLTNSKLWSIDILQNYFKIIKKNHPKLTEDAEQILSTYFQMQRRVISRNKARTTVRSLESLVRLSQGHARLMRHETVEIIDSIYAIVLVDTGMEIDSSILSLNLNINDVFPEKPLSIYRSLLHVISDKLGLTDIADAELKRLENCKENRKRSRFFQKPNCDIQNKEEDEKKKKRDIHEKKNTKIVDRNVMENKRFSKKSAETEKPVIELTKPNCESNLTGASSKYIVAQNHNTNENSRKRLLSDERLSAKRKIVKNSSCNSDSENDEGYDTISFSKVKEGCICEIFTDNTNKEVLSPKISRKNTNGDQTPSKFAISSNQCKILQNVKICEKTVNNSGTYTSEKCIVQQSMPNGEGNDNILDEQEAQQYTVNKENDETISSTKKYFERYRFKKQNKCDDKIEVKYSTDQVFEKPSIIPGKSELSELKSLIATSKSTDSVVLLPNNNDLNINLEFDWNNFKPASGHNSTMISIAKNQSVELLALKSDKINKLFSRKSSSNNSTSSSLGTDCNSSMPSSSRLDRMFEEDDEDLDLRI